MKLDILEESKKRLVFKLKGEDHTFCNLLCDELNQNPDVEVATYNIDHPLVGIPKIIIETKKEEPKKILKDCIKELTKKLDSLNKEFKKAK